MSDRHAGAPEATRARAATVGWACDYPEGAHPQHDPRRDSVAWATGCGYCRIARVSQAVMDGFAAKMEVSGPIATLLGVADGAMVEHLDGIRAACIIAGDDALLTVIERLQSRTDEPGDDDAEGRRPDEERNPTDDDRGARRAP